MPTDLTEKGFEQAVEHHLLGHGYTKGNPSDFDPKLALDPKTLVRFLRDTQPKEWEKLGGSTAPRSRRRSSNGSLRISTCAEC